MKLLSFAFIFLLFHAENTDSKPGDEAATLQKMVTKEACVPDTSSSSVAGPGVLVA